MCSEHATWYVCHMYQDTERKVQGSGIKTTMLDASKVLGFGSGKKTKYFSVLKY